MTTSPARHKKLQAVMKQGFMSFIGGAKPRRKPQPWLVPPANSARSQRREPAQTEPRIDPVELTVMAVNRLGLATFRTATSGKCATVSVPDARTAEIFRAALREMEKVRRTDRLVEVIISGDDRPGAAADAGQRRRNAVEA